MFCNPYNSENLVNPLPDDKILDRSKLKQIADDILKCIKMENKNHTGKKIGMATSNRLTSYSFERPNIGYRFQYSITW